MSAVFFPFLAEQKQTELSHYPFVTKFVDAMQKKGLFSGRKHSSARTEFLKDLEPFKSELKKSGKYVSAFTDDDFKYIAEEVNVQEENRPALHAKKIVEIVVRDSAVADELAKQLYTEHITEKENIRATTNALHEAPTTPTIDVLQEILNTDNHKMNPAAKAQEILKLLSSQVKEELSNELAGSCGNVGEFLAIKNIVCYGSDGKPFEQYDTLLVAKDIVRGADGSGYRFTPYEAIAHFEKSGNGLFLPSYALQCAVLVALFKNRVDPEVNKVLMQYKNRGSGYCWHNNNTIVDGKNGRIIHYPSKDDFPTDSRTADINKARQKIKKKFHFFNFFRESYTSHLEDALKNATKASYTKDLTGLKDPRILIDIAKYFGKTAWSYPAVNSVCSAWLGCDNVNLFNVDSGSNLYSSGAARGVRRG